MISGRHRIARISPRILIVREYECGRTALSFGCIAADAFVGKCLDTSNEFVVAKNDLVADLVPRAICCGPHGDKFFVFFDGYFQTFIKRRGDAEMVDRCVVVRITGTNSIVGENGIVDLPGLTPLGWRGPSGANRKAGALMGKKYMKEATQAEKNEFFSNFDIEWEKPWP